MSWHVFDSCDIYLENMPTSHVVSLTLFVYACIDSAMLILLCACLCSNRKWCTPLLVPSLFLLHSAASLVLLAYHDSMYYCINRWAYFQKKSTLFNNFIQKGSGLILRMGLFSRDYGTVVLLLALCLHWVLCSRIMSDEVIRWFLFSRIDINVKSGVPGKLVKVSNILTDSCQLQFWA